MVIGTVTRTVIGAVFGVIFGFIIGWIVEYKNSFELDKSLQIKEHVKTGI